MILKTGRIQRCSFIEFSIISTCASKYQGQTIEELSDRREGKGHLRFFGYLMQLEGEGGVIVRQSFRKRLMEI